MCVLEKESGGIIEKTWRNKKRKKKILREREREREEKIMETKK